MEIDLASRAKKYIGKEVNCVKNACKRHQKHATFNLIATSTPTFLSSECADRFCDVCWMNHMLTCTLQHRVLMKDRVPTWRFQQLMPDRLKIVRMGVLFLHQHAGKFQTGRLTKKSRPAGCAKHTRRRVGRRVTTVQNRVFHILHVSAQRT